MQTQTVNSTGISPFHAGEQQVQTRLGVRDSIEPWARQVVRPYLPDQHRDFYSGLPFLVAAARDSTGRPWATLLTGRPGFVHADGDRGLRFDSTIPCGDALHGALQSGADLGLLGIDLETRRRNRVNGQVNGTGNMLQFEVRQAFGNCPQYIHPRAWRWVDDNPTDVPAITTARLEPHTRQWISTADTLFIATGYRGDGENAAFGMDASHRGGPAGFVKIVNDSHLVFPDYAGNNHYNTIGNLAMDASVGLLFVDFDTGSMLQITGSAGIDWDSDRIAEHPGAQRLVTIDIDQVIELRNVLPLRWSAPRESMRTLRLIEKTVETNDVTSFVFSSRDDGPLPDFEAGQHLPIEIHVPGIDAPQNRTYSLSNGPVDDHYRISVKREPHGIVSRHLHDQLRVGDFVDASIPGGEFVLMPGSKPVVLISAGIGVTPMVSMLHELVADPLQRPTWFIHGARDGQHHALVHEVESLAANNSHIQTHVTYSQPADADLQRGDHQSVGRVDVDLIASLLPNLDAEFYLCGPTRFLAELSAQLNDRGVQDKQIHSETFGPSM